MTFMPGAFGAAPRLAGKSPRAQRRRGAKNNKDGISCLGDIRPAMSFDHHSFDQAFSLRLCASAPSAMVGANSQQPAELNDQRPLFTRIALEQLA